MKRPERKLQQRLDRLKAIEREFNVARLASERLTEFLRRDSSLLTGYDLGGADVTAYVSHLEATYLLRLFAEFEACLRDWWRIGWKKGRATRKPHTADLISQVAAKRSISSGDRDKVHAVREYRNALTHEESAEADPVSFAIARSSLSKFLSWLPPDW
jgi:hypothetical protein